MVSRGNWATYFTVLFNCGLPPNYVECESAFGYNASYATCFLDIVYDGGFFGWGWTNGALAPGNYTLSIYAGASDCDLNNGTFVGTLTVNYDGLTQTATVTYNMITGYLLIESHLYVGSEILPWNETDEYTIAPGRFPHKHLDLDGATSDTYTITGLTGNIYVVAHAVVCGTL